MRTRSQTINLTNLHCHMHKCISTEKLKVLAQSKIIQFIQMDSPLTRTQSGAIPIHEYAVDIDFDEASEAWLANKKRHPDATYSYKCLRQTKMGRECNRKPVAYTNFCYCHKNI